MGEILRKPDSNYTYKDYLAWAEDERWEIIDGTAYMQASPSRRHQEIQVELLRQISNYLRGKACKVYGSPFDVRFPMGETEEDKIRNVVQPDITIVCDREKLDDRGCKGSPDMVVEIVSPSTAAVDYIKKLALYEKNGVKAYWIVQPVDKVVMVYRLGDDGRYGRAEIFSVEDKVKVGVLEDLVVDLGEVFGE